MIYSSDEGLDMRFSREGMYGQGIYFANNALYSKDYAYKLPNLNNTFQMFLVFVLTGNQIQLDRQDKSLRMPPTI